MTLIWRTYGIRCEAARFLGIDLRLMGAISGNVPATVYTQRRDGELPRGGERFALPSRARVALACGPRSLRLSIRSIRVHTDDLGTNLYTRYLMARIDNSCTDSYGRMGSPPGATPW
jgi:hypothetical protein